MYFFFILWNGVSNFIPVILHGAIYSSNWKLWELKINYWCKLKLSFCIICCLITSLRYKLLFAMMTFHSKFKTVIKITLGTSNLSQTIQLALIPHISTHTVNQPALHVNQSVWYIFNQIWVKILWFLKYNFWWTFTMFY